MSGKHKFFKAFWNVLVTDSEGNNKFTRRGYNALADEGERVLLNTFFRQMEEPQSFYIRLCSNDLQESSRLSHLVGEPDVSTGYAPLEVTRDSEGFPEIEKDADGDYVISTKNLSFICTSGVIGPVRTAVIATTSDNTGSLLSFMSLGSELTIQEDDTIEFYITIKAM